MRDRKLSFQASHLAWFCLLLAACTSQQAGQPTAAHAGDVYRPPTAAPPTIPSVQMSQVGQTPAALQIKPATLTPLAIQNTQYTPLPSLTPTPSGPIQAFLPTATTTCIDALRFLEDLSVPDGSQVAPGEIVDKRWKVENTGTCNWDEHYRLRLTTGSNLGATIEQALYPARAGTQAVIRIIFTAPLEAGTYRSAWQAQTPRGELFGDPIYLEIVVVTQ
jgi:hypothetical protein